MRRLLFIMTSIMMIGYLHGATNKVFEIIASDVPTYLDSLNTLAENGDADALFELGYYYYMGYGFDGYWNRKYTYNFNDRKKAVEYLKKSAAQNNTCAQYYLGLCYNNAFGVIEDSEEAFRLVKLSAENGNHEAQYMLGMCFKDGTIVKRDVKKAYEWFRLSAEQGNPNAQRELYLTLSTSKKEKDQIESLRWKSLSSWNTIGGYGITIDPIFNIINERTIARTYLSQAQDGDPLSQYNIGECYEYGNGIELNYASAFYWYSCAANQGNVDAQWRLSRAYALGIGTPISYRDAYFWELIAKATGGGTVSSGVKVSSERFLSPKEKKEIKESATKWFDNH